MAGCALMKATNSDRACQKKENAPRWMTGFSSGIGGWLKGFPNSAGQDCGILKRDTRLKGLDAEPGAHNFASVVEPQASDEESVCAGI